MKMDMYLSWDKCFYTYRGSWQWNETKSDTETKMLAMIQSIPFHRLLFLNRSLLLLDDKNSMCTLHLWRWQILEGWWMGIDRKKSWDRWGWTVWNYSSYFTWWKFHNINVGFEHIYFIILQGNQMHQSGSIIHNSSQNMLILIIATIQAALLSNISMVSSTENDHDDDLPSSSNRNVFAVLPSFKWATPSID